MAAPSGSKKGWAPSRQGGSLHLEFTVTVWEDETTPRFSLSIIDPNYDDSWLPDNMDRTQVMPLMEGIRHKKRVYFAKERTITAQLLRDLYFRKQRLALVSLEFWKSKDLTLALRFENTLIDDMYGRRLPPGLFESDNAPSIGLYNRFSMVAENVDWYNFRGHHNHHLYIQKWRDS
jgi:hypothetical protein